MSISSHKADKADDGATNGATVPRVFDDLGEFFAHLQALDVSEIFISVTTKPPLQRDPRADVYHAVIEARFWETVGRDKKNKPIREERHLMFCAALELQVVDQLAQPKNFEAMTQKALASIIEAAQRVGLNVRRGSL